MFQITHAFGVHAIYGGSHLLIGECPGANGALEVQARRKSPPEQRLQVIPWRSFDFRDDVFERYFAPTLQHSGVERTNIGEMPIETAARDSKALRKHVSLERGEAGAGKRAQARVHRIHGT